ncbi:MAG: DUF3094 family protein [Halioglobus sp.]
MTEQLPENSDDHSTTRLYPEDQAKVDAFTREGINAVERKPFRPFRLLLVLIGIVFGLSIFSQMLVRWAGIY